MAKHGFRYDSALMDSDHPYRLGETMVELPVHWSLDDWNRWNYVPGYASSPILRPSDVEAAWAEELDAIVEVGGLFNVTMHPFVSGRPARAAAIERLIERARAIDGLWIAAGDEIAAWVATLDLPPVTHAPPEVERPEEPAKRRAAPTKGARQRCRVSGGRYRARHGPSPRHPCRSGRRPIDDIRGFPSRAGGSLQGPPAHLRLVCRAAIAG